MLTICNRNSFCSYVTGGPSLLLLPQMILIKLASLATYITDSQAPPTTHALKSKKQKRFIKEFQSPQKTD